MCPRRVAAHPEGMFTTYEITQALVADHQSRLRREATLDRLVRHARRARRSSPEARPTQPAA